MVFEILIDCILFERVLRFVEVEHQWIDFGMYVISFKEGLSFDHG